MDKRILPAGVLRIEWAFIEELVFDRGVLLSEMLCFLQVGSDRVRRGDALGASKV